MMNRQERRTQAHIDRKEASKRPENLTLLAESDWPQLSPKPQQIWMSRKYVVQVYAESTNDYPGLLRLTINRTNWKDGLTWEEIQQVKREVGFGDRYAIEVYPRDRYLINVANMRHLWLLPVPLSIGWFTDNRSNGNSAR